LKFVTTELLKNAILCFKLSSYSEVENTFGITVNGIIEIDTERKYDDSFATPAATPEPATLLIMLINIIGLATIKCVRNRHLYFSQLKTALL
jgi:hypothetical protein